MVQGSTASTNVKYLSLLFCTNNWIKIVKCRIKGRKSFVSWQTKNY